MFVHVARAGGLSAAARAHGGSPPTLGRRMRALERRLGRELFVRRTHGYDLTDEGRDLLHELEGVAARIERVTAPRTGLLPLVKLSAGTWTALHLVRHMAAVTGDPADVRLRFAAEEAVASIRRREAAIGVRNRRPAEAGLAARRLSPVHFRPYRARGKASDAWIGVLADTPSARWVRERGPVHEASRPRLALDMALAGAGRAVLPTFVGDGEPGLEPAGAPIAALRHDRWLVFHDDGRRLPEVRRTIDRVAALLG